MNASLYPRPLLAFLNIAAQGMNGTAVKLTQIEAEKLELDEMDVTKTSEMISEYPDIIVGVKIGHVELLFDRL